MNSENWLLVGGPNHGETMFAEPKRRHIEMQLPNSFKRVEYQCMEFCIREAGKAEVCYRVGYCDPTPKQRAEVGQLIREKALVALPSR